MADRLEDQDACCWSSKPVQRLGDQDRVSVVDGDGGDDDDNQRTTTVKTARD